MKRVDILILDDNFIIAKMVKKRFFNADKTYKHESLIELFPHYLEVDNNDYQKAAVSVNDYIRENNIRYLLLDRGFGKIIEPIINNSENLDVHYVYKDNNQAGYHIEELLLSLKQLKNSSLSKIKGVIIYTYDDYREVDKQGEVIKEEILDSVKIILPAKCKIDVLLAYSDIYKIANVDLYEGYSGAGIIKLGKKNDFLLYGIFVGELLYHKAIQMISLRSINFIKEKRVFMLCRLLILYLIFISISVGANAIFTFLFKESKILIGVVALLFGLLLPIAILYLKPSLIIDIEEQ
ncbi:MAG: hypothetical protein JWN78_2016 [Bacteroidota bacterium]|nr:hypothetical protein [Bacteroidota bacterium]